MLPWLEITAKNPRFSIFRRRIHILLFSHGRNLAVTIGSVAFACDRRWSFADAFLHPLFLKVAAVGDVSGVRAGFPRRSFDYGLPAGAPRTSAATGPFTVSPATVCQRSSQSVVAFTTGSVSWAPVP